MRSGVFKKVNDCGKAPPPPPPPIISKTVLLNVNIAVLYQNLLCSHVLVRFFSKSHDFDHFTCTVILNRNRNFKQKLFFCYFA